MTLETIVVSDQAKTPWIKPVVRSVSAGSAESGGLTNPDGAGTQSS